MPSVRHDWLFPLDRDAFVQRMLDLALGWGPEGLGQPNPYPMTYWVTLPLAALVWIVPPVVAIFVLLAAIPVTASILAHRISYIEDLPRYASPVLATLLLFNPWTYNKLVAGHPTMTLAYLGMAGALFEITRLHPQRKPLAIAIAVSALQTQFFLVVFAAYAIRFRSPCVRWALGVGVAVFLPSIAGIVLNRSTLLTWPFTVPWENDQSVALGNGLLLQGYFTHYAQAAFSGVGDTGVVLLAFLAVVSLATKYREALIFAVIAIAAVVFCSGTIGPLGFAWRWGVIHAPVLGVFRELYDMIAVTAIAYVLLAAKAMRQRRVIALGGALAALLLLFAWVRVPPATYWVNAAALPTVVNGQLGNERYALDPAFQPLSYQEHGEGADPLFVARSASVAPINALLPGYPADVALAKLHQSGDIVPLSQLGAAVLICRSGFSEAPGARVFYGVGDASHCENRHMKPAPVFSYAPSYGVCTVCIFPQNGSIFFGDLIHGIAKIDAQRQYVDPNEGWIDARLAFAQRPDLGEPFGGAYTRQAEQLLAIPGTPYLLVSVTGRLSAADGSLISLTTRGYSWVSNSHSYREVRCKGECVVALGSFAAPPSERRAKRSSKALTYRNLGPIAALVTTPLGGGILRYIEHYDASWTAIDLSNASILPHVVLDAAFNGWLLPRRAGTSRLLLIEGSAAIQAALIPIGLFAIFLAFFDKGGAPQTRENGAVFSPQENK